MLNDLKVVDVPYIVENQDLFRDDWDDEKVKHHSIYHKHLSSDA